jgi:poly-gamma-glutamate synthesis protein (capsule biosynthesis protein)
MNNPGKIFVIFITIFSITFLLLVITNFYFLKPHKSSPSSFLASKKNTIPQPTISQPEDKTWTLTATGDVGLVRSVNFKIQENSPRYPFKKTAQILQKSNLTIINLEGPLIKDCPIKNDGFIFCGDQKNIQGLEFAGIDLVNLANNHIYNYGVKGVEQTTHLLENHQISYTGLDYMPIKEVKGLKIAFLGYNLVGDTLEKEHLAKQLQDAENKADVTIVSFHWGQEYTFIPNSRQRNYARFAVDNGADLILGHHPHVVQEIEKYRDKLIVYSHGNFIFDQMWSLETREGVIGKYTFNKENLIDYQFIPVLIKDYSQPVVSKNPQRKEEILKRMK